MEELKAKLADQIKQTQGADCEISFEEKNGFLVCTGVHYIELEGERVGQPASVSAKLPVEENING